MANPGNRAPQAPNAPTEAQNDETRMRRALGLSSAGGSQTPQQRPEQARQRHRFVQDGGVPVVMLNHKTDTDTAALRERIASLEAALEAERASHKSTRQALVEQQAQTTALTTRLAHDGLAHKEALAQERALRIHAQEALSAAAPRRPARPAPATPAADGAHQASGETAAEPDPTIVLPPKPKRGRPRSTTPPEPKPVRWWTPSFKAKMKS
jgi:DNA-binding protein H-NS